MFRGTLSETLRHRCLQTLFSLLSLNKMYPHDNHHSLNQEQFHNGGHHHVVQYDTIKEVPEVSRKKSSLTAEDSAENTEALLNPDLDGGYGWVIVVSSFFVAFVTDGIGSSFGLLFPYIMERFGASAFVTTFAGSMFVAFLIMGSVSAELVRRFGFRAVTITGSILSCIAFVASIFASNIYIFIFTFGLFGGCSCGLVFIPSIIIVNEYFHQKRGIANGIISSGSGVGLLVLAPIINVLLDTYSLDGALFILAGVLLNMCVVSSLFRSPGQKLSQCDLVVGSLSSNLSVDNVDHFSLENVDEARLKVSQNGKEERVRPGFDVNEVIKKYSKIYLRKSTSDLGSSADQKNRMYLEYLLAHLESGVPTIPAHCRLPQHRNQKFQELTRLTNNTHWKSEINLNSQQFHQMEKQHRVYSMPDIPASCQDKEKCINVITNHKFHHSHRPNCHHSQYLSINHGSSYYLAGSISTLLNLHNSFIHTLQESGSKTFHSSLTSSKQHKISGHLGDFKMDSERLLRQNSGTAEDIENRDLDIFVPAYNGHSDGHDPAELLKSSRAVAKSGNTVLAYGDEADDSVESGLDLPQGFTISQLLCMPSFHFFCLGASLIQIGYPLAGTFLADYAYQLKLTTSHTAVLMGLLGGLNICGRLLAGALVSLKVDPLLLTNVSLLLGGAACLMSPLYTEFWSLSLFASMFGFFLGFFPPLQPLIIVKYFGLNSLASAFGFLSTIKGVASILGAPLAGCIYDVTGQYSMSFMFGGAVFMLSSFVHYAMTFGERCKCKNKL